MAASDSYHQRPSVSHPNARDNGLTSHHEDLLIGNDGTNATELHKIQHNVEHICHLADQSCLDHGLA